MRELAVVLLIALGAIGATVGRLGSDLAACPWRATGWVLLGNASAQAIGVLAWRYWLG